MPGGASAPPNSMRLLAKLCGSLKPMAYVDVGKNCNASAMRRASGLKLYGVCVGNSPIMSNIVAGMRKHVPTWNS